MEHQLAPGPPVEAFVEQLLDAGGTLVGVVDNLVAGLVEHGSQRDDALGDILEMLVGTVSVKLASVPAAEVARAAELMELAMQAVLADLARALELARRRERRRGTDRLRPS